MQELYLEDRSSPLVAFNRFARYIPTDIDILRSLLRTIDKGVLWRAHLRCEEFEYLYTTIC